MSDMTATALTAYHDALTRQDAPAVFQAVRRLLAQTCPHEPHDEQDQPLAGPQLLHAEEAEAFRASEADFQALCDGYVRNEVGDEDLGALAAVESLPLLKFVHGVRTDWRTVAENLAVNPAYQG